VNLPVHLEALYERFPFDRSLAQDPLSCVRPFRSERRAAEIAGIFAATLAIGTTTSIRHAFDRFFALAGADLEGFVECATTSTVPCTLASFRHRWIRGDQLYALARRLNGVYESYGSLEEVFRDGANEGDFAVGLDRLSRALRGGTDALDAFEDPAGYRILFPSPLDASHSPCKRMTLFVRWMVRSGYPDLGLWEHVSPSELRIPLDLHVYWIAYHLGLTRRRTRNWATVEEVTSALRAIDPVDPVKFDFVLCHTGISGDCPKTRDLRVCGPCVVRPECLLWRGAQRVGG
jgi:uncharacterized protein (TIGR02757 family)